MSQPFRKKFTLKELRLTSKKSIDEITTTMQVSKVSLHSWEKGTTPIPLPRLAQLLQIYNATADDLDWDQTFQDIATHTKD